MSYVIVVNMSYSIRSSRGGGTWRPTVTPTGSLPRPGSHPLGAAPAPVTSTSLKATPQPSRAFGSGHNNVAKPFGYVSNFILTHKRRDDVFIIIQWYHVLDEFLIILWSNCIAFGIFVHGKKYFVLVFYFGSDLISDHKNPRWLHI